MSTALRPGALRAASPARSASPTASDGRCCRGAGDTSNRRCGDARLGRRAGARPASRTRSWCRRGSRCAPARGVLPSASVPVANTRPGGQRLPRLRRRPGRRQSGRRRPRVVRRLDLELFLVRAGAGLGRAVDEAAGRRPPGGVRRHRGGGGGGHRGVHDLERERRRVGLHHLGRRSRSAAGGGRCPRGRRCSGTRRTASRWSPRRGRRCRSERCTPASCSPPRS